MSSFREHRWHERERGQHGDHHRYGKTRTESAQEGELRDEEPGSAARHRHTGNGDDRCDVAHDLHPSGAPICT
jgi:hypothetical protein